MVAPAPVSVLTLVLALILGGGLSLADAGSAGAQSLARMDAAGQMARQILADGRYQRALPTGDQGDEQSTPTSGQSKPSPPSQSSSPEMSTPEPPQGLGEVGQLLLWLLAVVGLALLGFYLYTEVMRRLAGRAGATADVSSVTPDPVADTAPQNPSNPLDTIERLAREGRHGEAIHALLLLCVAELSWRHGVTLSPATTGREMITSFPLSDASRSALARLVRETELDLFGGRSSDASAYQDCLDTYRRHLAPAQEVPR